MGVGDPTDPRRKLLAPEEDSVPLPHTPSLSLCALLSLISASFLPSFLSFWLVLNNSFVYHITHVKVRVAATQRDVLGTAKVLISV